MKIDEKLLNRLRELISFAESIIQSSTTEKRTLSKGGDSWVRQTSSPPIIQSYQAINRIEAKKWQINTLNILEKICTISSNQYIEFKKSSEELGYENIKLSIAILKAVEDDYENGYLFNTRTLIEAEVFNDFIQQAEELLKKGYFQPAAVITGSVLEDGLRKLCDKNNITFSKKPTINPMNDELAKIGVYNNFVKDKVSSIGKLRNHAAHGEWDQFEKKDVEDMIRDVRRFMEDYFS